MPNDGAELMLRFVRGDDQAFEPLLKRYENEMMNYFLRLTGERQRAEDLTQELFLRVFRYRDSYKPASSFRYFIYRIARNLWIDVYRKRRVRPRTVPIDPTEESAPGVMIAEASPGPSHRVSHEEEKKRLEAALTRLPVKQREVVVLAFHSGLKYAQIAKIMEIPVGTVKSRMNAALTTLRGLLGRDLS